MTPSIESSHDSDQTRMNSDRGVLVTRRLTRSAIGLLLVAAVTFGMSFAFGSTIHTTAPRSSAPVSVPAGIAASLPRHDEAIGGVPNQGELSISFRFQKQGPVGNNLLFNAEGVTAVIRHNPETGSTMFLHFLNGGPDYSFPIVHNVSEGRWYAVTVLITNQDSISAFVNGRSEFELTTPTPSLGVTFSTCVLGAPNSATTGSVAISDFILARRTYSVTGASTEAGLRVLAGFLLAAALVLLLSVFVTSSRFQRYLGLSTARKRRDARNRRWLTWFRIRDRRMVTLGLAVFAAGVILLVIATPPENNVLVQTGRFHLGILDAAPKSQTAVDLGSFGAIGRSTSTMDVALSYKMRVGNLRGSDQQMVVTTQSSDDTANTSGIRFFLDAKRRLWGTLTYGPQVGPSSYQLSKPIRVGRWSLVEVQLTRGQKVAFFVDGALVGYQEYSAPGWQGAAQELTAGTNAPQSDITIKNLSLAETLYSAPTPRTKVVFSRSVQLLGFLLVAAGTVLIASRLLKKIFGEASSGSRPLILVVFGVAALGILVNLFIDLLHLQSGGTPYITRNTWVFSLYDSFTDFLNPLQVFRARDAYSNLNATYPPTAYWLVAPFYWTPPFSDLFIYLASFLGFFCWWLWHSTLASLSRVEAVVVLVVAVTSFPMTYAISRANIDISVFVLLAVLVACLERQRLRAAASLIGVGIAAKLVPGLFLVLFLQRKRWRFIWLAIAVAASTTLLAFLWFTGGLNPNAHHFLSAFTSTQKVGARWDPIQITFGTNLSVWAQTIGYTVNGVIGASNIAQVMQYAELPLEVIGALLLALYVGIVDREFWRVVTLVTVAMLLLPTPSGDYELLYLFVPLALFLRSADTRRRHLLIAIVFGVLLAPRVYFFIGPQFVSTDTLLNAPLLVLLAVLVIRDGLADRSRRGSPLRELAVDEPQGTDDRIAVG